MWSTSVNQILYDSCLFHIQFMFVHSVWWLYFAIVYGFSNYFQLFVQENRNKAFSCFILKRTKRIIYAVKGEIFRNSDIHTYKYVPTIRSFKYWLFIENFILPVVLYEYIWTKIQFFILSLIICQNQRTNY